jgi:hypothetical protein
MFKFQAYRSHKDPRLWSIHTQHWLCNVWPPFNTCSPWAIGSTLLILCSLKHHLNKAARSIMPKRKHRCFVIHILLIRGHLLTVSLVHLMSSGDNSVSNGVTASRRIQCWRLNKTGCHHPTLRSCSLCGTRRELSSLERSSKTGNCYAAATRQRPHVPTEL